MLWWPYQLSIWFRFYFRRSVVMLTCTNMFQQDLQLLFIHFKLLCSFFQEAVCLFHFLLWIWIMLVLMKLFNYTCSIFIYKVLFPVIFHLTCNKLPIAYLCVLSILWRNREKTVLQCSHHLEGALCPYCSEFWGLSSWEFEGIFLFFNSINQFLNPKDSLKICIFEILKYFLS